VKISRCSLIILTFIFFIGLSIIPSTGGILENKPSIKTSNEAVLYVGGIEPGNYSTIQSAIDDANPGDTVFVYDEGSPYYENVRVHKRINLIGESRNTTVIKGVDDISSTVSIAYDAYNVLVSGFTITGGSRGIGMTVDSNIIQNNKIIFNTYGIKIHDDSDNNVINNNIIVHNFEVGVYDDCQDSNNTVTWNVISGNGDPDYKEGGLYKHQSGGSYHHNDFDLNWGYNAFTDWSSWGVWDDGSEGNYWDSWESNPGYPDVYIIEGNFQDQIDYHPSATPYFNYPIVRIHKYSYEADPNELIHFLSHINKPISSLSFFWDFGDGTTSSNKDPDHSYSKSGIYQINITVTDDKGISDTDRSIAYIGLPPDKPTIKGPTMGRLRVWHKYSINATDPDSKYLHYYIDWGDGWYDNIGPYPTGETVKIRHDWLYEGNYTIRVKAIDETLRESEWAFLNVQMIPRNRVSTYSFFLWFFEQFPLLERLLTLFRVI